MTITGKTMAEELQNVPDAPRRPDVIFPLDRALYDEGHLAILIAHLSPEGCVQDHRPEELVITGPARVFDDEQSAHCRS